MTDNLLTLFCLVDGDSVPFSVDIDASKTVDHLKDAIKDKKAPEFDDIAPDKLVLWRVSIPLVPKKDRKNISLSDVPLTEELDETDDVSDVFPDKLPKKTIHVIVQRPPVAGRKQTISEAFPNGLPYQMPGPLLRTSGGNWIYQPDPELFAALQLAIKDHFDDFKGNRRDKSTMPLYLFLSGAGTGKSRNAQEFHRSALNCLTDEDDPDLREGIRNAWVFHVTLENGTSPSTKELDDPIRAIGSRMLLQLLPGKELYNVLEDYEEPHPIQVLSLVARGLHRDLKSATVILVVDGLQSFMTDPKDGHNKDSAFYRALTRIGDLALGEVFLMACCTATVTSPVEKALASTHRNRVILPVASLKSPHIEMDGLSMAVFDEQDHIIKVLVSDCGGHGRALECLHQVVARRGEDNVESLMNGLHLKLQGHYSEAFLMSSSTAQAIARAILTRAILDPDKPLAGTDKLPGELAIPGLVRYEQKKGLGAEGYLTAPYIWVWLMSYGKDPLLNNFRFNDGQELESKMDPRSPPGAQFWQHFEHFLATFRCLKSRVLEDGELTRISAIHTGARLRGNINFTNHHLKLTVSSQHVNTKSYSHRFVSAVRCENKTVNVRKGKHCIINAPSAPYGDSFTGIDAQPFCTEVHQCKLITDGARIDYQAERRKAASDNDFFMLFTSQNHLDVELPPLSGIVDGSNWEEYFGPFAGRAFVFATTGALDINLAQRRDLERMRGVGDGKAELIIQERSKRKFDSYSDADKRLRGVGKTVLKNFKFS
ncbi:hypothetical protein EC957_009924 [Mortierella hygrophila]|uniref:Crinkler effector protein N-terminal domain-containing protein n=1 Tax=Mortierella hygrophila TaxID=979708 RepID=A0A9P6JXG9_9FUNG|nr:hypothetical protein EC957_009924 [Mortierella hygrophila]